MKKTINRSLIFSLLILMAICLFGCTRGKDFSPVSKEYEQSVSAISLELDISDIVVKRGEGDKLKLDYHDTAENAYFLKEQNGVVTLTRTHLGELKENIRFGLGMKKYYKVTLSVPEGYSGALSLKTTSGDISLKDSISGEETLNIKSETGDISVDGVSVSVLNIDCTASGVHLKNIKASSVDITTVTGDVLTSDIECASYSVKGEAADVDLDNVSIGSVSLALTAGDVELGNVKIGNSIAVSVTSGAIDADGLDTGHCTVTSKSGDIFLKNLWIGSSIYLISESGDINVTVSDPVLGFTIDSVSEYGKNNLKDLEGFHGFKKLTARNVTGDISIKFADKD